MTRTSRSRQSLVAVVGCVMVTGMTGCTDSGDNDSTGVASATTTTTPATIAPAADPSASPAASAGTLASSASAGLGTNAEALPVIATHKGSQNSSGQDVSVALNSVVVRGGLMTVTFSASSSADKPWSIGTYFYAGNPADSQVDRAIEGFDGNVDGVYVLDPIAKKRYLPARDKDGNCVCSSNLSRIEIGGGGTAVLEAVFAAPPAQTTNVDVVIPRVGSFAAVPLARL